MSKGKATSCRERLIGGEWRWRASKVRRPRIPEGDGLGAWGRFAADNTRFIFFAEGDRWESWMNWPADRGRPARLELLDSGRFVITDESGDRCTLHLRSDAPAGADGTAQEPWPIRFDRDDRFVLNPAEPEGTYERHESSITRPGTSPVPSQALGGAEERETVPESSDDRDIYGGLRPGDS